MIGRIRGLILEKQAPFLLIEVNGIAYEVAAPMTTFYELPDLAQEVTLFTHFVVREDAQLLYGFKTESDRRLFRTLIKVNGVGPKLALTILSGMSSDQFVQCVMQNEITSLIRIPGIGRKTAERLLIETKDALAAWAITENYSKTNTQRSHREDAIEALVSLGYKPKEAKNAIEQIADSATTPEELIRSALKQMAAGEPA